jgi:hypothetical protein
MGYSRFIEPREDLISFPKRLTIENVCRDTVIFCALQHVCIGIIAQQKGYGNGGRAFEIPNDLFGVAAVAGRKNRYTNWTHGELNDKESKESKELTG